MKILKDEVEKKLMMNNKSEEVGSDGGMKRESLRERKRWKWKLKQESKRNGKEMGMKEPNQPKKKGADREFDVRNWMR